MQNVELNVDANWSSCQTTVRNPDKILALNSPK